MRRRRGADKAPVKLAEQALLAACRTPRSPELKRPSVVRQFHTGERIIRFGDIAASIFCPQSGAVSVKMPRGLRLASLGAGMAFGEMVIIEQLRSADVWADPDVQCLELPLSDFREFRTQHPETGHCIMTNLPAILSKRLILANARIDVLSAYWRNGAKDGRIIETED